MNIFLNADVGNWKDSTGQAVSVEKGTELMFWIQTLQSKQGEKGKESGGICCSVKVMSG